MVVEGTKPVEAQAVPAAGKIAFVSGRDGNAEIYVMNDDGSGKTKLTSSTAFDGDPS